MKDKPILFNTDMVDAILSDKKTQTRRVIKPTKKHADGFIIVKDGETRWAYNMFEDLMSDENGMEYPIFSPYGYLGDKLWVRETWGICPDYNVPRYKADAGMDRDAVGGKWKPSIFMPKKYARIWLEVTDIRLERVQNISRKDIRAEGVSLPPSPRFTPDDKESELHKEFKDLWDSINKKRGFGWDLNPYVWVVEFKRIEGKHEQI